MISNKAWNRPGEVLQELEWISLDKPKASWNIREKREVKTSQNVHDEITVEKSMINKNKKQMLEHPGNI